MDEALYARAQGIAHAVLEGAPDTRAQRLQDACGEDAALRAEVQWLLDAAEDVALDVVPEAVVRATEAVTADLQLGAAAPGQYRLIRQIGEGGMGIVWLAERVVGGARQRVALKRLRSASVGQQARLRAEQRILASLDHPLIARLLDAGDDTEGVPFLAMEYVEGVRIDQWCAEQRLGLRARIALFIQTCSAVAYAHQRLIIHRDLKPANVLVDGGGTPRLLDFGIARLIDAETLDGTVTRLMTPAYASPEQIEARPLGTATDVWSLGVMLYELLSGVRPFQHLGTAHAQASAVLAGRVIPPSEQQTTQPAQPAVDAVAEAPGTPRLRLKIPPDVDAIVLKALRREPEHRYASVREMAEDLERFLQARPVLARRGLWAYRAQRYVQRNRWPLGVAVLVVGLVIGFTWHTVLTEREARLQALVAERTTEFLVGAFALSDPAQAGRHDYSAREVLDRGRERVERELADQPQVRARLLEALGNAYRGINEGSAGAPLLAAAARLHLDAAVDDPLAAARALRAESAAILASGGSTQAAEAAAQQAYALVQAHAPSDPLVQAQAHGNLAKALDSAGRTREALGLAKQALAWAETGKAGPLVIAGHLTDLCFVRTGGGDSGGAQRDCERALTLYAQGGAAQTNDYRLALRQLERSLVYSGQYTRGLAVARERIALTRTLYGEDSSVLATERAALTDRLAEQGLFEEAEDLLARSLPVILQRNGAQSTQYARAVFHAGWLNYLRGEFDQAVPRLREALAIHTQRVEGRDQWLLQVLRTTLAQVLIESGQASAESRALLDAVIEERGRGDAQALDLAYARLPLAQWHAARGAQAAAEALLQQVDAVGNGVERELHARVATTRATLRAAAGDLQGAREQARIAYTHMLEDRGPDNPRTVRLALQYAQALRASGAHAVARALEQTYGPRLLAIYPAHSAYRRLQPGAP